MEEWKRESLIVSVIDHLVGIAVAAAILVFVLKILAAQPGGRHYDAWNEACGAAAKAASTGKGGGK